MRRHLTLVAPGSGFSGFWYHLGLLQSVEDLESYDFYCYSSGCLSLILAYLDAPVDDAFAVCRSIQAGWQNGTLSSDSMVTQFMDELVPESRMDDLAPYLPRLNVLVTSVSSGSEVQVATDRDELVAMMRRTTWIPFVTGSGMLYESDYLDGAFSRRLHPDCEHTVAKPTGWDAFVHSLNPGMDQQIVYDLVAMGLDAPCMSCAN